MAHSRRGARRLSRQLSGAKQPLRALGGRQFRCTVGRYKSLGEIMQKMIAGLSVCYCLSISGAFAQNQTSARILALTQDKQFEFWTEYFKSSHEPCDVANRAMYQGGTKKGVDSGGGVACADGHSYSVGIDPAANGSTTVLTCAQLKEADALLRSRVGKPPDKDVGCWLKHKTMRRPQSNSVGRQ
jgi:hypothetical protein